MKTNINIPEYASRRGGVLVVLLLLVGMLVPVDLWAQHGYGAMADSMHHEPYNAKTVETVMGEVKLIKQLPGRMEGMIGIHAMLETGSETIEVHMGPSSYLTKQSLQIKEGDTIEVTGSRITHNDKPAILAKEVKRGDEMLILRNEQGKPNWRGKGKRKNH